MIGVFVVQRGDEKRIIRIQDVPSNCIEEMIVILKNNSCYIEDERLFIIHEAYNIIDDYVDRRENVRKKHLLKRQKKVRIDLNKILNYLLVIGIVVVSYMIVSILRR